VIAVERPAIEVMRYAWLAVPELFRGALAVALVTEAADIVVGVGPTLG
jgi:hypothetical protein